MNESITNKQERLEAFRAEIATLKKLEENENSVHFEGCNPSELGEEDKKKHEKLKLDILTIGELREYQNKLNESGNESQRIFAAYIANMLAIKALAKYKL